MPTKNVPATIKSNLPAQQAKEKNVKLINILKDDHNYDIIAEIVAHIRMLQRAKKVKPAEKHRMVIQLELALLSFCVPKMRLVEDNNTDNSKPFNFTLNLAGPAETSPKKAKGMSITIPTKKQSDGSFAISSNPDDQTD